ncbi:MAG TPA: RNA 2',3'-cyclic phosphodiesterase [Candidatus Acidoferrales bacterium]|jgi:2'-5' RNA ligase|nr:RNA 2',3'-cyclic phosphodiesterase [Candidatus Acidoferrales bacterium]
MRLFVGIPLATEVIDALQQTTQSLRSPTDHLRWASPETWHITLQFLGETSVEKYGCLAQHLGAIQSAAVPVWLHGTGLFDRAGVFFAGVNVSPELRRLEKLVVAATSPCGVAAEDRPYHPHVTLARAKGDDRARALRNLKTQIKSDVKFPAFTAREFLLYESFLTPDGARHEIREHFPLG